MATASRLDRSCCLTASWIGNTAQARVPHTSVLNNPGDRRGVPGTVHRYLGGHCWTVSVRSECGRSFLTPSQAAKCRGVKESAPLVLRILSVSISHRVFCHEVSESACLSPLLIASMGPQTVAALLENCSTLSEDQSLHLGCPLRDAVCACVHVFARARAGWPIPGLG